MKTQFNAIKEARESLNKRFEGKSPLSRECTAKALKISTATLHRLRNAGAITATITEINNVKHISYSRNEIAIMMFKRGV